MLKNQLVKAIKIVSFILLIRDIKIALFNFGKSAENRNSDTKLIPPKCKFFNIFIEIGIITIIGRKDRLMAFKFLLFNYLIDFI